MSAILTALLLIAPPAPEAPKPSPPPAVKPMKPHGKLHGLLAKLKAKHRKPAPAAPVAKPAK